MARVILLISLISLFSCSIGYKTTGNFREHLYGVNQELALVKESLQIVDGRLKGLPADPILNDMRIDLKKKEKQLLRHRRYYQKRI